MSAPGAKDLDSTGEADHLWPVGVLSSCTCSQGVHYSRSALSGSSMSAPAAVAPLPEMHTGLHDHQRQGRLKLAVGAIGIVFGDIGTSPIYAFRETFVGHHPIAPDPLHIHGVLSLIFWSMMIVVTIKYVSIIMRADNNGEGGSLALLALISRKIRERRWRAQIVLLGVFACALFYGDSMITPAISVLSAVEGLQTVEP